MGEHVKSDTKGLESAIAATPPQADLQQRSFDDTNLTSLESTASISSSSAPVPPPNPVSSSGHSFGQIKIQSEPFIQPKLTLGQPNDAYEQEADRVAAQVMQKPDPVGIASVLQCRAADEDDPIQLLPQLQRQGEGDRPTPSTSLEDRLATQLGGGSPLSSDTRAFMEPRFGFDFSQVRIHTDSEAVQMNRELSAQAFTHGYNVYFDAGKYDPHSESGKRLLSHELTHVVQQTGALRPLVQRYQAGETGHGGIEQRGLTDAGFTPEESSQTYLGNWLRDFSQMPKDPKVFFLVNLLALGEFGHEITPEELGDYVPSEHLDNPAGGESIEDKTYADESSSDPAKQQHFQELFAKLSPDQQAAYRREEAAHATISANAAKSKLPVYIERGKFHAKEKLVEAIQKRDTPEGHKELGNALHAIEDYFSHSNFVEAAIWLLSKSHPTEMKPLLGRAAAIPLGLVGAANLDKSGTPQIVTGTYVTGANKKVSLIETVVSEAKTGQLRAALVKGAIRKLNITTEMIGQAIAHKVGAPVTPITGIIGGTVGAIAGAGSGAVHGGKRGARIGGALGSAFGTVGEYIGEGIGGLVGGVVGGIDGATTGYDEGEAEGEQFGEEILKQSGKLLGIGLSDGVLVLTAQGAALLTILFPGIAGLVGAAIAAAEAAIVAIKSGLLDKEIEKKVDEETKKSAVEAKAKGVAGPTHSELAKDAPDHQLFEVSATLAQEAVKQIGLAMKKAWALNQGNDPAKGVVGSESVTDLVDKYVCHPDSESWWQPIVLASAKK